MSLNSIRVFFLHELLSFVLENKLCILEFCLWYKTEIFLVKKENSVKIRILGQVQSHLHQTKLFDLNN